MTPESLMPLHAANAITVGSYPPPPNMFNMVELVIWNHTTYRETHTLQTACNQKLHRNNCSTLSIEL